MHILITHKQKEILLREDANSREKNPLCQVVQAVFNVSGVYQVRVCSPHEKKKMFYPGASSQSWLDLCFAELLPCSKDIEQRELCAALSRLNILVSLVLGSRLENQI